LSLPSYFTSVFYLGSVGKGLKIGIGTLNADLIAAPYEAGIDLGFITESPSNFTWIILFIKK